MATPQSAALPGRVGLALGSGAARGWAHIGVIRALEAAGIVPDVVCRYLLKGTRWANLNIRDILMRISGAAWCQQRMGGTERPYGVALPAQVLSDSEGDQDQAA